MTEIEQRQAVVAEAMTWIGTRYAHRQRLKGVAVDCAQMPLAVYEACGVIPPTDVGEYSAQWHMHHDDERYLDWVRKFGREIARQDVQMGDFAVIKFGRAYAHGAIVVDMPTIVHAYTKAGRVTLDDLDANAQLATRPAKFFSLWGV